MVRLWGEGAKNEFYWRGCQSNVRHEKVLPQGAVTHRPQYGCLIALQLHPKRSLSFFVFFLLFFSRFLIFALFLQRLNERNGSNYERHPPPPPQSYFPISFIIFSSHFDGNREIVWKKKNPTRNSILF